MVLWEPRPRGDWTGEENGLVPNRREGAAPTSQVGGQRLFVAHRSSRFRVGKR